MAKRQPSEALVQSGVFFADGTFLDADAGYYDGVLGIWPRKNTEDVTEIFLLLSNPAKTQTIRYVVTKDMQQTWEGFTKIITLNVDSDNYIRVRLRREETENV